MNRLVPFALLLLVGCSHPLGALGRVDHRYVVDVPHIDDPEFGKSTGTPAVLRIPVSSNGTGELGYIGRLAHREVFADYPAFDVNVAFASSAVDVWGHSEYANPASIWFNVFFGFYEIDARKDLWDRPFGYASADADAPIYAADIERIGRADWNFFSNHLYGVPLSAIRACCAAPTPPEVLTLGRVMLRAVDGARLWDDLELRNVTVVGPNRSLVDGGELEHPHSETESAPHGIEKLWQAAFGLHEAVASPAASFSAVKLRGRIRMYHDEARVRGQEVYRTFVFGATVRADADPKQAERFLGLQLAALERVMQRTGLGFDEPGATPLK